VNIAVKYALGYDTIEQAAAAMALDLMRGDPRTFKAGYSRENALLAVKDAFEFFPAEWLMCRPTIERMIDEINEVEADARAG